MPSGPPPEPVAELWNEGCRCREDRELAISAIYEEEWNKIDALLPEIPKTSAGIFILEQILGKFGPEALEPWTGLLDTPFLLYDAYEIEEYQQEALEKIRKLKKCP
jgi:hypothetical protein